MNVEFKDGNAIMTIEDFMKHFNYDGKATGTYVAGSAAVATGDRDVYDIVTALINRKGLKPHLKGFKYVRKAVELCIQDKTCIDSMTKVLYPDVAKAFDTTASRVERAIRHSIETVYVGQKPTNSEFIAQLIEEVSAELKDQSRKVS